MPDQHTGATASSPTQESCTGAMNLDGKLNVGSRFFIPPPRKFIWVKKGDTKNGRTGGLADERKKMERRCMVTNFIKYLLRELFSLFSHKEVDVDERGD